MKPCNKTMVQVNPPVRSLPCVLPEDHEGDCDRPRPDVFPDAPDDDND